ncbi:hypothetical protein Y919_10835 [Caloranaerobacter azorensis H53214]|uniref:GGDEF domain-containing protein n=1 Tax=Caloranaerobacter azorensis H53214 TaxID=1156417 RepID=A0A096BER3_9FIRM|nr:type III-B CRISPR-associated protein Cas10/Cmr2 [Caloranaerobacter azorensis]KGG79645.1 hypothetical protein Y919_10835 [Caloranaerobacter azorensis H53214]
MKEYLLLFAINPAQRYIAQARKVQDLKMGSFILSYIINKTIEELYKSVSETNVQILFPHKSIQKKPNRFVAKVKVDNPKELGKELEQFAKSKFKEIASYVLKEVTNNCIVKKSNPDTLEKQINTYFYVNWVFHELDNDYYSTYCEIEKLVSSVKVLNMFEPLSEVGRKCKLCGERNIVFYRRTDSEESKGTDYIPKKLYIDELSILDSNSPQRYRFEKGEGLCAVCTVKRFGELYFQKESCFEKENLSTAAIAVMNWLDKISIKEQEEYKSLFDSFDEQLYYEENLSEKYAEKYEYIKSENKDNLEKARNMLRNYYKKHGRPPKYYALLVSDGDDMGHWLSGDFLIDKSQLKTFHENMSQELGRYADDIEKMINKPKGKVIYAGGDDVLAFVNLDYLLDTMPSLRTEFPQFDKLAQVKDDIKSSVSCGVVIAHYKEPLEEVLNWARRMEKEAKQQDGKAAFSIVVLKRSGEIQKITMKWEEDDIKPIEILKELVKELKNDKEGFSDTFIRRLEEEGRKFNQIEEYILKSELTRLLNRSCFETCKSKKRGKVEKWAKNLTNVFRYFANYNKYGFEGFISFLKIANFLAKKVTM